MEPPKKKAKDEDVDDPFIENKIVLTPILKKWKDAIARRDVRTIRAVFSEIEGYLEWIYPELVPILMSRYLERSKDILDNADVYGRLCALLEDHYNANQNVVSRDDTVCLQAVSADATPSLQSTSNPALFVGKDGSPTLSVKAACAVSTNLPSMAKPMPRNDPIGDPMRRKDSFSLARMLVKVGAKAELTNTPTKASGGNRKQIEAALPKWLLGPCTLEFPQGDPRELGVEFLQQATPVIPMSKGLDHDAIALALEVAVFKSVNSDHESKWVRKYWEKIDSIVVAICGDKEVGTIASMIAQGKFKSADHVVGLSEDDIMNSFLGKPLSPNAIDSCFGYISGKRK